MLLASVFVLISLFCAGFGHKILVFNPTFSTARVDFVTTIVNTLVEAENTVHVIIPEVAKNVKVTGSRAHKSFFVPSLKGNPLNTMRFHADPFATVGMRDAVYIQNMTIVREAMCADLIAGYDDWMELKKEGGYDVGIAENFHAFAIMELLKVKHTILLVPGARSGVISRLITNLPVPPSVMADPFFSFLSLSWPSFSLTQRAFSLAASIATNQLMEMNIDREDSLLRSHWPSLSPLRDSLSKISLIIENSHPLLSLPQYTTHQIVPIGGLTFDAPFFTVDEDIDHLLDSSNQSAVLISFSSIESMQQISQTTLSALLSSISKLSNVIFMWRISKFDSDEKLQSNLHFFSSSLKSVLGHPKLRVILSDMDATTFHEGAFAGVPFISLPLLGDQSYHAAVAIDRCITVSLDKDDVTGENITAAIERVLRDESFAENATVLAKRLRRWPHRPIDNLIRHIDYVAEYGRPLGLVFPQVQFWTYYCLDIIIPSLIIIIFITCKVMKLWIGGYYQMYLRMKNNIEKKRELEGNSEDEEEGEEPE
ncbi:hypothetical protein PFISCL1PPCAC_7561 [Pristionchus fissidentatus]|uniref:glucuronosyltransferase n=1 Tax=Pristionchus fissidentatus TaxID=1538716 RepID=A0AAV5VA05_9BILA|nr:hypothetical protein PFISCL1PPCAC_7561 [Pristionchus fissidentatus]